MSRLSHLVLACGLALGAIPSLAWGASGDPLDPPAEGDRSSDYRLEVDGQPLEVAPEALMARPSVVPILFVPRDWPIASAEVQRKAAALSTALAEMQRYYGDKLGYTFRLEPLAVVQAHGIKDAYQITWTGGNIYTDGVVIGPSFEGLVVQELAARGYPTPPAQDQDGRSALIFVKGAGGWAGGREFPSANGGWAILGDWCIDSIAGDVPESSYWWSGRRRQVGAAAHELGHSFGLAHPASAPEATIMGDWWSYPDIGFNAADRAQLVGPEKKPFFVARPVGFDYHGADNTTGVRQVVVVPGGEYLQSRNLVGGVWGAWQPTRIATGGVPIPGLTRVRSFSQALRPTDGATKQDFVDSTGTLLYSRAFVGGVWQPATVLNVALLGIAGVDHLWGFEQMGGTFGDPFKQVAIPFDGQGLYYRLYSGGLWGAWTYLSKAAVGLPGVPAMRSYSEVRLSATLKRQDILSSDHHTLYTRTLQNGVWSAWIPSSVVGLEIPVI